MKNPFNKEDHSIPLIGAVVAGALATGTGIWFYLRRKINAKAAYRYEHAQDYLKNKHPKGKKHKSDVNDLQVLVHHQQA